MPRTKRPSPAGDDPAANRSGADAGSASEAAPTWPPTAGGTVDPTADPEPEPGTTGRYLVLLRTDALDAGVQALANMAGLTVVHAAEAPVSFAPPDEPAARVFDRLGVAVVNAPPDQAGAVAALVDTESAILAIEPERVVYAIGEA